MGQRVTLFLALVVFVAVFAPLSGAQVTAPVPKCSKECYPLDEDVNPGAPLKGKDTVVKTILYGHFEKVLSRAPMNTQMPDLDHEKDLNDGFLMPVLVTKTGTDVDLNFENNWFIMYSSAGSVEFGDDGEWRIHQEPGLAEDVLIHGEEIRLYWYLSAHPVPNGDSGGFPGNAVNLDVMPQVAVFARMETGRFPMNSQSTVIAVGDTGKDDNSGLIGSPGRINVISQPGQSDVYEFVVPMKVQNPVIPGSAAAAGFTVSVNPYQIKKKDDPNCCTQAMQADWRLRTGINFPPRIVLEQTNALVTKKLGLNIFDNNLMIRWSLVSPWGSYDTDDRVGSSLQAHVVDEQGKMVDMKYISLVKIKRSTDHDGHFKPINITWKFDYRKADLADGKYKVLLSILNLQGTYKLEEEIPFEISGGAPAGVSGGSFGDEFDGTGGSAKEVRDKGFLPGFEALALAMAVPATLFILSRRRRP